MADLGADVVHVRPLTRAAETSNHDEGDLAALRFFVHNANKRVVTISFDDASQIADLHRLVEMADVLVEALEPGELARFGIRPDMLWRENPSLVITSITNFGQSGPDPTGSRPTRYSWHLIQSCLARACRTNRRCSRQAH